jgi:effector-binding domain-containing protein
MSRASVGWFLAPVLLFATAAAWGQAAPQREPQMGLKTSDACIAGVTEVEVKTAEMAQAYARIGEAIDELATSLRDAGFTILGVIHVAVVGPLPPPAGEMTLQVRMPVIEQPTEEDLRPDALPRLMKLEAMKVAYTYNKGPIEDNQVAFMRLIQWVMGQKLEIAGAPCLILYGQPAGDPMQQVSELQVPVK